MRKNKFLLIIIAALITGLLFFKTIKNTVTAVINPNSMNNPFNIRNVKTNKWDGLVNSLSPFCQFISIQYGVRAMIKLYMNYLKQGHNTLEKFITRFAPPSENDTVSYIQFVSGRTGIHPANHILTINDCQNVLSAMAKMESNYSLDPNIYNEAFKLIK